MKPLVNLVLGIMLLAGVLTSQGFRSLLERFGDQAGEGGTGRSKAMQASSAVTAPRLVALQGDSRGHFVADVSIDGLFIKALVDTGASIVALSAKDARKLGIAEGAGAHSSISTANGVVQARRVMLREVRLQGIVVRGVEAVVLPERALGHSLLGMSFIKRLASFEMQGRTLVLRQ